MRGEEYFYFDFKKIWESVGFSGKVLKKGRQLLKSSGIELKEVSSGYLSDKDEQVAIVEGTGVDGKWKFPIEVVFSRTQVLHVGCRCRECQSNYWRYISRDYCAYTYAMIKRAEELVREKSIGSATDKQGNRLLRAFRQNQANQVISGVIGQDGKVMLVPRLVEKEGDLLLSFRIGTKKLFVIKDLTEFYQSVKASST